MIFLRIRERARERLSEWFCACNMTQFGATLYHPSSTFNSPAYEAFAWFGEEMTGLVIGSLGVAWIIGLIVNGARQQVTSTIRMFCAFIGALVYGMLGIGFLWSYAINGVLSTGIGNYFLISVLVLYSLYWIAVDKRTNG